MRKLKLLIAACALMGASATVSAQGWTASAAADGDYYLYNVGYDGFVVGANDWGTRISLTKTGGISVTLAAQEGEGVFSIATSPTYSNNFMGKDGYVDKASDHDQYTTWKFEAVEGLENTYTLQAEAGGGKYLQFSEGTTTTDMVDVKPTTVAGYWKLVTKANYISYLQSTASLDNGLDATMLIQNPNFSKNANKAPWTMVASNQNLSGGTNANKCAESYRSTFTLTQTITGVPNGVYELTAQGFYRQDGSDDVNLPVFYINSETETFPIKTGEEGNMDQASASFLEGKYTIDPIRVTVTDGNISLGAKLENNTMLWCIFDNFQLKYYNVDLSAYQATINNLRPQLKELIDANEPMNASIKGQAESIYSNTESVANTQTAMETAITNLQNIIKEVKGSVANYKSALWYLERANSLDDSGQSAYNANEAVSTLRTAYDNREFSNLSNEQISALDAAIIAATKVQTTEGSDWTLVLVNPSFESGFSAGWTNSGMGIQNNSSFDKDGNNYCEKWQPDGTFFVKQTVTLPAGVYALTAKVKARGVASAKIFANGIETAVTVADAVNTYTVQFACDNNAEVEFGFEGVGTGAGNSWLAVDDFRMSLVSAGLPDVTGASGAMNSEVASAQEMAINTYNSDKTIANYNAAQAAIAAAQASVEAYTEANAAVEKAEALKGAHNFATEAATTTFAEAINAIKEGYNNGTLSNADATAAATTLGFAITGWHDNPNAAAVQYMNNGFGLTDFTQALYINTWSREGESDGSNFKVPFYEYWTGDTNSLGEKTWTATLTDMPNGQYSIKAWVRVRAKNEVEPNLAYGITMDVNGGDAVDVTEGSQIGTSQFQLQEYTAYGLVKDGKLNLNMNIAADNNISWLSFQHVYYNKERDLTDEEAFKPATGEDYTALANAIIVAESNLGFESGEYAPYNNVEAMQALAAAKAIDPEGKNDQADVQNATTALTNASWTTANSGEVNAIFDGGFEHDYGGQSGNINPIGWRRVKDAGADGYNVRLQYDNTANAGLNATSTGKALFTKQSAYYGYADGYTMPLKANTTYKVTFIYGGWGDCKKDGYVSMAAPDGSAVALSSTDLPLDAVDANSNTESWKQYSATFTTGEAGNYVLGLRKKSNDTSGQSQYVYGDIKLFKATGDDLKEALQQEIASATVANVGTGIFQRPTSAGSALTSAKETAQGVYDNTSSSYNDVQKAIEDLKAAKEAYNNAELNAPDANKHYWLTIHDADKAWDGNAVTFIAGARKDQGGYGIKYLTPANKNLAQAVKFTATEGNKYKVSVINAEGTEQYITTAKLGYDTGANEQIRTTTEVGKALEILIQPADVNGEFRLFNTAANKVIANNDNNDMYTNRTCTFSVAEAEAASISVNTAEAGFGTIMVPFDVTSIPEGVKVYTCTVNGTELNLVEADAIEANKPYVIEGSWTATLTGDAQGAALTYDEGSLTGVYADQTAVADTYVMQNGTAGVGFYKVASGSEPTVGANHAFLTVNNSAREAYLLSEATAIKAIEALTNGKAEIYNAAGARQQRLQKGVNIIKNGDKTVKVMVK